MNLQTCESCTYWNQKYPENKKLGVCTRMGALAWGEEISISVDFAGQQPVSDFSAVRTLSTFGCIFHSSIPGSSERCG